MCFRRAIDDGAGMGDIAEMDRRSVRQQCGDKEVRLVAIAEETVLISVVAMQFGDLHSDRKCLLRPGWS